MIYTKIFGKYDYCVHPFNKLSDLVTLRYGKNHLCLPDGLYPVFGSGGVIRYVEKFLYDKESVLIPRKGSLNHITYQPGSFWAADTIFYTEEKMPHVTKFLFHFLKNVDLEMLDVGSAIPSMRVDILNELRLCLPARSELEYFENTAAPYYKMLRDNEVQSKSLDRLREVLWSAFMKE